VWFGASHDVAGVRELQAVIAWRPALPAGASVTGPAILEQYDTATVLPPEWTARVDGRFNLVLTRPARTA
jgi:N-methylhydantoinase A/oxoprolinase/acetone carboxylase beta subunit